MAVYAVTGATSWGLTLGALLARQGAAVRLICRNEDEARGVAQLRGIARLPEVRLPEAVEVTTLDGIGAVDGIVVAVPAQSLRAGLSDPRWPRGVPLLFGSKGIEHGSLMLLSEVVISEGWAPESVAALSGPNLAKEVARGLPAASVVACPNLATAQSWQLALSGPTFRVYTSLDIIGVEVAGALKNVVAIAAGASTALGFGVNSVAALLTRGLAEISRLGVALGASPSTFQGLAGVGDLVATCFSPLSRNQRLGAMLARGMDPAVAVHEIGEAVEGAATASIALELGRRAGVELPITAAVAAVLEGTMSVPAAMLSLLSRPPVPESGGP